MEGKKGEIDYEQRSRSPTETTPDWTVTTIHHHHLTPTAMSVSPVAIASNPALRWFRAGSRHNDAINVILLQDHHVMRTVKSTAKSWKNCAIPGSQKEPASTRGTRTNSGRVTHSCDDHSRTFPFGDSIRKRASNYVDRVRIRDSSNSFGGPGRGSGWRQKSLSNIDLPTSYRGIAGGGGGGGSGGSITGGGGLGAGQFRYRDYDSGLYDLYSRIDSQREEYEDLYGVNPKAARAGSSDRGGGAGIISGSGTTAASNAQAAATAAAAGGNNTVTSSAASGGSGAASGASKASGKKRHNRNQDTKAASEHGGGQHHHHHHHHHHHNGGSQQQQQQFYNPDSNEACSLRRTRSLAVIREESYNELHLPGRGGGSRRSQLIPRAKLTDRNFFKERFSYIYDDNGELPPGSPTDGDSGYSLARRFASSAQQPGGSIGSQQQQPPFPWHTDKSDLDSIDSSIFKHSLHQQSSFEGSRRNSVRSDSTKFVSKVEVHSEYSGVSGSGSSGQSKSDTGVDADLRHLDDLSLREGNSSRKTTGTSKNSTLETIKKGGGAGRGHQSSSSASGRHRKSNASAASGYPAEQHRNSDLAGNRNRKYGVKEEDESGITIIEIKDSQVSHKSSSVISYDSIYLSSESDEKELLDEHHHHHRSLVGPPLPLPAVVDNRRRRHEADRHPDEEDDPELIDIKFEDYEQLFHETDDLENAESTIDTLYGQVTKPKPKIVAVEPKVHGNDSLRRYIKNTSRSTIERLSLISNLKLRQEFGGNHPELGGASSSPAASPAVGLRSKEKHQQQHQHQQLPLTADSDYQYNSLPDADVCKILRNSERIDAKLRRIADSEHSGAHGNEEHGGRSRDGTAAFDSLPRLHKSSLALTQPPSDEDISLEESDKGAPSIEVVETPTKEVLSHASSKVYLKDVGVELDYENSVVTGNSDQESDITIVAPQEDLEVPTPAIVVTPADKHQPKQPKQQQQQQQRSGAGAPANKGQRPPTKQEQSSVVYSTFASTAGKQTTTKINYESKEPKKPNPEALREVRTKLKPIPVVQTEPTAPKVPLALAPTVKLGGKKVIVDEVAAKAAKREKELVKTTPTVTTVEKVSQKPTLGQTKDINNARDASPGGPIATRPQEPIPIAAKAKESREDDQKQGSPKVDHSSLFKETNPFKEQARREIKNKVNDRPLFKGVRRFNSTENIYASTPIIVTKTFNNCIKTNEIKTKSFDSLIVENGRQCNKLHPKMPRPQVIQIVDSKQQQQQTMATNGGGGADTVRNTSKNGQQTQREFLHKVDSVRSYWSKMLDEVEQLVESDGDAVVRADTADERLMNAKNDLLQHQQQQQQQLSSLTSSKNGNAERKASIGSATSEASDSSKNTTSTKAASSSGGGGASIITTVSSSNNHEHHDGQISGQLPRHTSSSSSRNKYSTYQLDDDDELNFQSFSPTVEIIELDGHKQAALVKPKNAKDLDFDHVRYKVMKSEMFQKNLLVNHRKAAQFDGLMQYLQDYSFQELLAHNNVVIIEPVRTKIEKISEKPPQMPAGVCKITNGALQAAGGGKQRQSNGTSSSGIKKHFFYHPIRVNKELLDEELPSPDTVRNVRKLFEGTLRLGTAAKQAYEEAKANGTAGIRKWDSASLSSGVSSSGDLSSPCDCGTSEYGAGQAARSVEHLCGIGATVAASEAAAGAGAIEAASELLESHYVSQDVLEKIRECGSTVTYYGGRVLDKRNEHISTMTRAIMREIRGQDRKCGMCQPHNCIGCGEPDREPDDDDDGDEDDEHDEYEDDEHAAHGCPSSRRSASGARDSGVKFKLVKSNSCSSRLELAGTGKTPPDLLRPNGRMRGRHHILEENGCGGGGEMMYEGAVEEEAEETVRDMVSRLESGGTLAAPRSKPRIIESKCIEKYETVTNADSSPATITINNQTTLEKAASMMALANDGPPTEQPSVALPTPVTVNNHINFVHHSAATTVPPQPPPIPAPLIIPTMLKGGRAALECPVPVASPAMHSIAGHHPHTTSSMDRPVKVCRNKNVDLAFAATMRQIVSMNQGNNSGTGAARVAPAPSSVVRKSASLLSMSSGVDAGGNSQESTDSAPHSASSVTKTVTFNFTTGNGIHPKQEPSPSSNNNNNENGIHHHPQHDHHHQPVVAVDQSENLRPSAIAEQRKMDELTSPKLVNWSTIGRFDERQYFANDRKLIEKRKYDDMEFEEFEVLDPNAPPSSEQHYDSLNSKC
ncbi:hypothetical protein AND_008391 [Anopheles darlingi]|uniref:Uncharacterized protein n=1 Tax=Anopheles darlingi TaxID=43151 RepID=W5J7P9_ANODA|nr:hypothetical protein AND_008391 [Anopheles darlingi]